MKEAYSPEKIESKDVLQPIKEGEFSNQELVEEYKSVTSEIESSVRKRDDQQSGEKRKIEADSGLAPEVTEKIAADMSLREKLGKISEERKGIKNKIVASMMAALSFLPAGMKVGEAYAQTPQTKNERVSDIKPEKPEIKGIDEELERISRISTEDNTAERERQIIDILDDLKKSKNPMHGMSEKQQIQNLKKEMESAAFMEKIYNLANPDRRIMNSNIEALARGLSSMFGIAESEAALIIKEAFRGLESKGLFVHDNRQKSDSIIDEAEREDGIRGRKSVGINFFDRKF